MHRNRKYRSIIKGQTGMQRKLLPIIGISFFHAKDLNYCYFPQGCFIRQFHFTVRRSNDEFDITLSECNLESKRV